MRSIGQIFVWEWKRILRLPVHYWVLLVLPPVLFFFFAFIYQKQKADHLPVAIWDEDHSSVSRQFTFLLNQSEALHITGTLSNRQELEQKIKSGEILGAIHFPRNMEADIKSRHPVPVALYTNAAAMVPAKLIYKSAAEVIITAGSGVILQKLVKKGMNKEKAMALVQPLRLTTYTLYNPDYNYQNYLVPGLITVGMQMVLIMIAVLMLNYEWKTNTIGALVTLANGSASGIIAGKTLAHLSVSWINFLLIAGIIFPLFQISVGGALLKFFLLYNLLALACLGIGQMVSALFMDEMLASDIALFYTSPAFVFSGFTFPRWAMPWYDQYYANIMPYTAFLDAYFKAYSMNLPLSYAGTEIGRLLLFPVITFPVAILVFQRKINKIAYAAT
jgi:ABC-2 type transport system permease protein